MGLWSVVPQNSNWVVKIWAQYVKAHDMWWMITYIYCRIEGSKAKRVWTRKFQFGPEKHFVIILNGVKSLTKKKWSEKGRQLADELLNSYSVLCLTCYFYSFKL